MGFKVYYKGGDIGDAGRWGLLILSRALDQNRLVQIKTNQVGGANRFVLISDVTERTLVDRDFSPRTVLDNVEDIARLTLLLDLPKQLR